MAVKASANITLFHVIDIDSTTIYYLLQSSTANPPAKPTTDNPGGSWTTTEPTYTEGSTNTLYTVTKTKFSDGTFEYTPVSKSSSYEAAKSAYNKAYNTENTLNNYISSKDIIVGTQTKQTRYWTGVTNMDSLNDGDEIVYWLPYASVKDATSKDNTEDKVTGVVVRINSTTTKPIGTPISTAFSGGLENTESTNDWLNLTLKNGNKTGWIPCYYSGATRLTTHYGAGNVIRLVYRINANVNGVQYTGWFADANYVGNDTYDRIRFNNAIKAKSAISASRLIVGDDSGYFHLLAGVTFKIDKPILWANAAIAANSTGSDNYLSRPSLTMRNNTSSSWTATQYKTLYLVGILNGDTFTVDSTTPFTTTTPVTEDGKYYISLGYMYSTYQIYLYPEHPIFKYMNGAFKNIAQIAYEAQSSATEAYKIIISDEEPDASKRDKIWYDTENNKFKEWNSTSSTWEIIHNYTSEINDAKALIEQAYDPTVKLANTLNQMMSALNNTVLGETIIVSETAPTSAADKLKIWLDVNNLSLNKWDYTMTYNLLTSKPSNWDTNYKDYYILVDGKYKSITDDTAPTWQTNTYYSGTKSYSWMPVSPSSIMTTIDSHTVDIQKLKDKVVFDFETETDKVSFKDNWDTVFGKVKTLSQRFEFSALGLTITSSDSTTYKLRLTNEDIKILANDKEVTWWNATGFNCPVVTTESIVLRRKNFDENESRYSFRFVYNTNGSVSFRKVVES